MKPVVKGWCPSAHRPMLSGDGLVFRVRPFFGELSVDQMLGLCDLSDTFGNGMLDLTSRANVQIRGVAEGDQDRLLTGLDALGVIDTDPEVERHRNVLMPPVWTEGDLTHSLYAQLMKLLPELPELPAKIGFAIDTAAHACLQSGSADFRFELSATGALVLRADGSEMGKVITEGTAIDALREMIDWFVATDGRTSGRMARHLRAHPLPESWMECSPRPERNAWHIGPVTGGVVLGAPFGKIATKDMRALLDNSHATRVRPMLNRKLFLKDGAVSEATGFVTTASRLMDVHACPGSPYCPQATVETLAIAMSLADVTEGVLHVSGCSKGCAFPKPAATTLVGRDGRFDLVTQGKPWDDARQRGLDPQVIGAVVEQI